MLPRKKTILCAAVDFKRFGITTPTIGAADYIALVTQNISKTQIKNAFIEGGMWLQNRAKKKKQMQRLRRASFELRPGDLFEFYFDPLLPVVDPDQCCLLEENQHYGLWYKVAGVLSQGTKFGDRHSLLYHVEKIKGREVHMINRLDRETAGIMMLAYDSKSAKIMNELWQGRKVRKFYQAIVIGDVEKSLGRDGEINMPIENQTATTRFRVLEYCPAVDRTLLEIELVTGRLHQIRIHMDRVGHPVYGDPLYGKKNKNSEGLQLVAYAVEFIDPFRKREKRVELAPELRLRLREVAGE